ncbi:hypothetical protein F5144DRAFT_560302 [Chaetomium tenue]|uniref:Uncharacterized protein n=1 Tax=Chaetomium tenue TaxID=1854479 RepID=A0ACB7PET4_9PEZI|nr:hypothetical protein F5144DRAFT_560302 [Chaetomium globosum]
MTLGSPLLLLFAQSTEGPNGPVPSLDLESGGGGLLPNKTTLGRPDIARASTVRGRNLLGTHLATPRVQWRRNVTIKLQARWECMRSRSQVLKAQLET